MKFYFTQGIILTIMFSGLGSVLSEGLQHVEKLLLLLPSHPLNVLHLRLDKIYLALVIINSLSNRLITHTIYTSMDSSSLYHFDVVTSSNIDGHLLRRANLSKCIN